MKKILLMVAGVVLVAPFFVSAENVPLTDQFTQNTQTACADLHYNMSYRSRDARTSGEVSDLQDFLISNGYLSGDPTGYFGTATLAAVKSFQSAVGLGSAGSPGYGGVGPKSRAYIKNMTCAGGRNAQVPTPTTPVVTPTPIITPTPLPVHPPVGCSSFSGYSMTTGQSCAGDAGTLYICNGVISHDSTPCPTPTPAPTVTINTGATGVLSITYQNLRQGTNARIIGVNQPYAMLPITFSNVYPMLGSYTNNGITSTMLSGSGQASIALPSTFTAGSYVLEISDTLNGWATYLRSSPFQIAPVTTTTASAPTVEFIGTPTLSLQYDSTNRETNLIGNATVRITAGNTSVSTLYVPYVLKFWKQGLGVATSNSMTASMTGGPTQSLGANTSATFTLAYSVPAKELFAGAYYLGLSDFSYLDANGTFLTLPFTSFRNAWGSNAVTIIGETSPYVTSIVADPSNTYAPASGNVSTGVSISGIRFDPASNVINVGGITVTVPSSNSGTLIRFVPAAWGIAPGTYLIQVTSPTTGASNRFNLDVVAPATTPTSTTVTGPSNAVAFGVYSGGAVASTNHQEQAVSVTIPSTATGKTLVLTAYEPVNWVINNPSNVAIKNIIAVGFYSQRVTGAAPNVPIEYDSYYTNGVYQYAYQATGTSFTSLVSWLAGKQITLTAGNFKGSYSAAALALSTTTSGQSQLASVIDAFAPASATALTWAYTWTRNLEVNSSYADDVSALQTALTKEGVYTGEVTGGFHSQTYLGVKALQAKYGIESTGFVGPITLAKLNELY